MGRTECRPGARSGCGGAHMTIEAGEEHLDHVFMVGAQQILVRIARRISALATAGLIAVVSASVISS